MKHSSYKKLNWAASRQEFLFDKKSIGVASKVFELYVHIQTNYSKSIHSHYLFKVWNKVLYYTEEGYVI